MEPASETAVAAPPAHDLDSPELYTNRELSWLDFNERVLQLAEDDRTPLLERAKFLAIYTSNLDEFVMVRLAGLHDQVDAGIDARKADDMSPSQQITAIGRALARARRTPVSRVGGACAPGAGRSRHPGGVG